MIDFKSEAAVELYLKITLITFVKIFCVIYEIFCWRYKQTLKNPLSLCFLLVGGDEGSYSCYFISLLEINKKMHNLINLQKICM